MGYVQGVPEYLFLGITFKLRLGVSVGAKTYGKILLMLGHFEFMFLKFQQIEFCLPYSSVSYWGCILNLHRKCIFIYHNDFIFALISRHSVWSDILHYEGKCAIKKNVSKIIN